MVKEKKKSKEMLLLIYGCHDLTCKAWQGREFGAFRWVQGCNHRKPSSKAFLGYHSEVTELQPHVGPGFEKRNSGEKTYPAAGVLGRLAGHRRGLARGRSPEVLLWQNPSCQRWSGQN